MAKLSAEAREKIRNAARHPVRWMRGDGLPEEQIRPWEQAVHIVPNLVAGIRNGFTWNVMYLFQNVFGVKKNQQSVISVSSALWDGINDPVIGAYMDSHYQPMNVHRWIMRINVVVNTLLSLLPMFSFGLTPWQHVAVLIACNVVKDLFGTANTVSNARLWAHATPHSAERAKLSWASGIGTAIHEMLMPIYLVVIGLRDVLGWSEYSIYIFGAVIFSVPAIFLQMGPSFMLQRVPDKPNPRMTEEAGLKGFLKELKECFMVVRHNRFFMLDLYARGITVLTPGISDNDFYRYCGVDEVLDTGRIKGEFLLWFRDNIVSAPCNLIVPFALPIIKKVGGPRNMQVLYQGIDALSCVLKFAVGMRTQAGVLFSWVMEMFRRTFGRVKDISGTIINYEMLDYVEWKTGRRSEGVNMAVDGLLKKMVLNNIDTVVGNLVINALGFDPSLEKKGLPQPALFQKWAPVLYLLVPAIDSFVYFIARLLYKYPASLRDQVEADLIERRALAEAKLTELEQEAETV